MSDTLGAGLARKEARRLAAVRRYQILDTPPEASFDRLTRIAALAFDAPVALLSIVDSDRVWFKSKVGFDIEQMARDSTLCASVISSPRPVVVSDARTDPRTAANLLVTGDFGLRFYCGVPVRTDGGHNLGALCVLDRRARTPEPWQVTLLEELALLVSLQIELRLAMPRIEAETRLRRIAESQRARAERDARTDALTGLRNRRAFEVDLELLERVAGERTPRGIIALLDIDDLKLMNDTLGHAAGDRYLRDVADELRTWFRESDGIYRIGGDEFALVVRSETVDVALVKDRLRAVVDRLRRIGHLKAGASAGVAAFSEAEGSPRTALQRADVLMYAEKHRRRSAS
jgi:diguanylate cyclase (GGDEF)-like protein